MLYGGFLARPPLAGLQRIEALAARVEVAARIDELGVERHVGAVVVAAVDVVQRIRFRRGRIELEHLLDALLVHVEALEALVAAVQHDRRRVGCRTATARTGSGALGPVVLVLEAVELGLFVLLFLLVFDVVAGLLVLFRQVAEQRAVGRVVEDGAATSARADAMGWRRPRQTKVHDSHGLVVGHGVRPVRQLGFWGAVFIVILIRLGGRRHREHLLVDDALDVEVARRRSDALVVTECVPQLLDVQVETIAEGRGHTAVRALVDVRGNEGNAVCVRNEVVVPHR